MASIFSHEFNWNRQYHFRKLNIAMLNIVYVFQVQPIKLCVTDTYMILYYQARYYCIIDEGLTLCKKACIRCTYN